VSDFVSISVNSDIFVLHSHGLSSLLGSITGLIIGQPGLQDQISKLQSHHRMQPFHSLKMFSGYSRESSVAANWMLVSSAVVQENV
jgi:hypothetical protein